MVKGQKRGAGSRSVECRLCGEGFRVSLSVLVKGYGKYCSRICKDAAPVDAGTRAKQRAAKLGGRLSGKHRAKIAKALRGRPCSIATRQKIADAQRGEKAHTWRGGKTEEARIIRECWEYRLWRKAVYDRDGYACVECATKGGWNKELGRRVILNADHIKPFSLFPELRLEVSNGRTLCLECHMKTPTWGVNTSYAKVQ